MTDNLNFLNLPLPTQDTPLYKRWYFWLLLIIIMLVAINLINQGLAQKGWLKDFKCTSWIPYSQEDYDSGKQCYAASNCTKIDDANRVVEKCACNYRDENETFELKRICVEGYEINKYQWNNEFYDKDLNKTIKFGG